MDPVRVRRLVDAVAASQDRLEARVSAAVRQALFRFDGWYDERLVAEVSATVADRVDAGARRAAALTDAYLAQVASEVAGQAIGPAGLAINGSARANVPSTEAVYSRLAGEYRFQVSRGIPRAAAQERVLDRAGVMAVTDIMLAARAQSRHFMVNTNQVEGYRRVIRPELARTGSCGLCVVASDRLYHRENLMPIHDRCHCKVVPVGAGGDAGMALNRESLDTLYGEAGSTAGADLKRVRVREVEHGELGPVLVDANHRFRGPRQVAAAA